MSGEGQDTFNVAKTFPNSNNDCSFSCRCKIFNKLKISMRQDQVFETIDVVGKHLCDLEQTLTGKKKKEAFTTCTRVCKPFLASEIRPEGI